MLLQLGVKFAKLLSEFFARLCPTDKTDAILGWITSDPIGTRPVCVTSGGIFMTSTTVGRQMSLSS